MNNNTTVIVGNAVDALINGDVDVLLHVTNDVGAMGSGIALEIKNKIPNAFEAYSLNHKLGHTSVGKLTDSERYVMNMSAQRMYGTVGSGRFLNYGALADCLSDVMLKLMTECTFDKSIYDIKIGIPVRMGAYRAGGDWEIVKEMCDFILGKLFQLVYYDLDKG